MKSQPLECQGIPICILYCNIFGGEQKQIDTSVIDDTAYAHGGGDKILLDDVLSFYEGTGNLNLTDIDSSFASHVIGFNAELSRLNGGKLIKL